MTQPGIEPWSPGSLANTITTSPMEVSTNSGVLIPNMANTGFAKIFI